MVYRNYPVDVLTSEGAIRKRPMNNSLNYLCNFSLIKYPQMRSLSQLAFSSGYYPSFPSDKYSIITILLYFKLILGEALNRSHDTS